MQGASEGRADAGRARAFPRWLPPIASAVVLGANRAIKPGIHFSRKALWDESAHLATTALVLDAAGTRDRPVLIAALASSVLIDTDHIVEGYYLSRGIFDRRSPYTQHALWPLALAALGAGDGSSRRGRVLRGVALGLGAHLLRDAGDGGGGVPLLWPLSRRAVRLPRSLVQTLIIASPLLRLAREVRGSSAAPPPPATPVSPAPPAKPAPTAPPQPTGPAAPMTQAPQHQPL